VIFSLQEKRNTTMQHQQNVNNFTYLHKLIIYFIFKLFKNKLINIIMNLENMDIILQENISLKDKIILLEDENNKLSEKLKKYTSPDRNKKYYANHKDEIKQKIKEYNIQNNIIVSSEKRKEYNKRAYLKRKEKNNDK